MRKFVCLLTLAAFVFPCSRSSAQSSVATLDVVSWNIEWFGAPSNGPSDKNLQEANAKKVLRYLGADIYGVVEVVDTMRFRRLVDSLGPDYTFVIAPYATNNTTGTGNGWLTAQKLAFIYNRTLFTNVRTRGMMRTSTTAYNNFATGRLPFLLNADVSINGNTRNINFILLHAKAGDTQADYIKRQAGAQELKDTLDAQYSNTINIIFGDFNDALNRTICASCGTNTSSYDAIVRDSMDADHYRSITMPLANTGQTTMINFPNVIDNHVVSNELAQYYIPGTVSIRTDVTNVVPDYLNGTTSDHYPVFSQYNLANVTTGVTTIPAARMNVSAFPNPFPGSLMISFGKSLEAVQLQIHDASGSLRYSRAFPRIAAGTRLQPQLGYLPAGSYFLTIQSKGEKTVLQLTRQ